MSFCCVRTRFPTCLRFGLESLSTGRAIARHLRGTCRVQLSTGCYHLCHIEAVLTAEWHSKLLASSSAQEAVGNSKNLGCQLTKCQNIVCLESSVKLISFMKRLLKGFSAAESGTTKVLKVQPQSRTTIAKWTKNMQADAKVVKLRTLNQLWG